MRIHVFQLDILNHNTEISKKTKNSFFRTSKILLWKLHRMKNPIKPSRGNKKICFWYFYHKSIFQRCTHCHFLDWFWGEKKMQIFQFSLEKKCFFDCLCYWENFKMLKFKYLLLGFWFSSMILKLLFIKKFYNFISCYPSKI